MRLYIPLIAVLALAAAVRADEARDTVIVETLMRLKRYDLAAVKPETKEAVLRHIDAQRGTPRFVELVGLFNIRERGDELLRLALEKPDDVLGVTAAAMLVKSDGTGRIQAALMSGDDAAVSKAARVFGATQDPAILPLLGGLAVDVKRSAAARNEAVRGLGRGPAGEKLLLELVTQKKLPADLHFAAANVLLISRDEKTREEASKYLALPAANAGKPLPPVAELVKRKGDAAMGQTVFLKATCVTCHKVGELGIEFGPNLSEIGDKLPREPLYESILAPSSGISFGYEGFLVTTHTGPAPFLGYIASETEDNIVLKQMGGVATTIKKSDIKSREKQTTSLMTPNLQQVISEQELVDLVEYLATLKKSQP